MLCIGYLTAGICQPTPRCHLIIKLILNIRRLASRVPHRQGAIKFILKRKQAILLANKAQEASNKAQEASNKAQEASNKGPSAANEGLKSLFPAPAAALKPQAKPKVSKPSLAKRKRKRVYPLSNN